MSTTIDAITERLSPDNVKEQVKEQMAEQVRDVRDTVREATIGKAEDMVRSAGETVSDARAGVIETIKQNPIPAALAGPVGAPAITIMIVMSTMIASAAITAVAIRPTCDMSTVAIRTPYATSIAATARATWAIKVKVAA